MTPIKVVDSDLEHVDVLDGRRELPGDQRQEADDVPVHRGLEADPQQVLLRICAGVPEQGFLRAFARDEQAGFSLLDDDLGRRRAEQGELLPLQVSRELEKVFRHKINYFNFLKSSSCTLVVSLYPNDSLLSSKTFNKDIVLTGRGFSYLIYLISAVHGIAFLGFV